MHKIALLGLILVTVGCGSAAKLPALPPAEAPLLAQSPWPKFRANLRQDGTAPIHATQSGGLFWKYATAKGIFSNPVIGADGTIYLGSADRYFYALNKDGTLRWKVLTGEVIDSAALLDDKGRIYFGSGDGQLRALDPATGKQIWSFAADPVDPTGLTVGILNWYEGNVGIGTDGTLYVPNDVYYLYGMDRDLGTAKWKYKTPSVSWSCPAVNRATSDLFISTILIGSIVCSGTQTNCGNTFAIKPDGSQRWLQLVTGSVAASPMLTADGKLYIGGFDGYLRQYDQATGAPGWSFATRDHIYASPGLLPDGSIVQPSADGSVYALDPASGAKRWEFDTREPIRSSPAIDADGNIYLGTGEGRLIVLGPDGKLRWGLQLIHEDRNDMNSSVSLGRDAVYLAGESGEVFSVPYEYCLRPAQKGNPDCIAGPGGDLPSDGVFLYYTTGFGRTLTTPPPTVEPNQPLALSLYVRQGAATQIALIDPKSVTVTVNPPVAGGLDTQVSADGRFLTLAPRGPFTADAGGNVTVSVSGDYLVNPMRSGLVFTGGTVGGQYKSSFTFAVAPATTPPTLAVPADPSQPSTVWEMSRLAAPLPTVLPSYNQIGFDSLHYLFSMVEPGVAWGQGAILAEGANTTVVNPQTTALFPLQVTYQGGQVTFFNDSFTLELLNLNLPFKFFRVSAMVDAAGQTLSPARVVVNTKCSGIGMGYGVGLQLLGFCNATSDIMDVFGAANLKPYMSGTLGAPAGVGTVSFAATGRSVTATLSGSSLKTAEHSVAVLLVDAAAAKGISLDYGNGSSPAGMPTTVRTAAADGTLTSVATQFPRSAVPGSVRAYLMVDGYPAARATLTIP